MACAQVLHMFRLPNRLRRRPRDVLARRASISEEWPRADDGPYAPVAFLSRANTRSDTVFDYDSLKREPVTWAKGSTFVEVGARATERTTTAQLINRKSALLFFGSVANRHEQLRRKPQRNVRAARASR